MSTEIKVVTISLDELRAVVADAVREAMRAHEPEPQTEVLFATAKAYAARAGVSLRTVRKLVADGLPTVGSGRMRRIDVKRADAWMREHSDSNLEQRARDAARAHALRVVR
jgi:hypothetical protein